MTNPIKCSDCDGRGWKIVTRLGHAAAAVLGEATSSQEDCLHCDGPQPVVEMFDWEVFLTVDGEQQPGPCGTTSGQATSMDALRSALRRMDLATAPRGRIMHRVHDFGAFPDDWARRVIFRATVDPAGTVQFIRTDR
ncbi:hypothetical protein AB0B89_16835 [Sphaerisporangium sp. NPDC049002]|uniref:hypothetical protein n=1 Tax=Sphaerisporangium sp. NPDC049002 TaxID=3155392 RepID=UPI0033F259CC